MTSALDLFREMSDGTSSVNDIVQVLRITGRYSQRQINDALGTMLNDENFFPEARNFKIFFVPKS